MIGILWKVGWKLKNSRFKLRGAYFVLQLLLGCILMGLFAIAGVYSGSQALDSYRADLIEKEGQAIDNALRLYSKNHQTSYPTGKVNSDGVPITRTYGMYPESIDELHYQAKYGYISTLLAPHLKAWSTHGSNAQVGDFYYEASEDRRAYLLQARLPSGHIYTTPGSLYTVMELNGDSDLGDSISDGENEWGSSIRGKSKD